MRIVVKDKRFGSTFPGRYPLDIQVDYKAIPDNLPLSAKALKQYSQTKSPLGYTTFRGLTRDDIITILSAVKRQEARLNVNRMGLCAYYKLISNHNQVEP